MTINALSTTPTQAGFTVWVRNVMGVPTNALPDNADAISYAYLVALQIVNPQFQQINPAIYVLMVYNLGGDNLVNWASDVPPSTFFADLRGKEGFNTEAFIAGVVSSSSDEGTSVSMDVVDNLKSLTVGQLQNLKTPWGRQYLTWAMSLGSLWGLT